MADNSGHANEIQDWAKYLEQALHEQDLDQVAEIGSRLQRSLVLLAMSRNRDRLRELSHYCQDLAQLAFSMGEGISALFTIDGWGCRLQIIAETASEILAQDSDGTVEEDLQYVKTRSAPWEETILVLGTNVLMTAQGLREYLAGTSDWCNPKQATDRHLSRMIDAGFVHRIRRGLYRLTGRGQAIYQQLMRGEGTSRSIVLELQGSELRLLETATEGGFIRGSRGSYQLTPKYVEELEGTIVRAKKRPPEIVRSTAESTDYPEEARESQLGEVVPFAPKAAMANATG
jgi:DNA-binding PadR family transcriptional regulator